MQVCFFISFAQNFNLDFDSMKKIILPFLLTLLFLNFSHGAENSDFTASEVHYVGSSNNRLGTDDQPVTANEYCAFLNSNDNAASSCVENYYYDSSFMNLTSMADPSFWLNSYHYEVRSNDCITRLNEYRFRYIVIPGRGNYIINGLNDDTYGVINQLIYSLIHENPHHIINEFNNWRKNPTSSEICDYINQRIQRNKEEADLIKNSYQQDSFNALNLDLFALEAQLIPTQALEEIFYDERQRPIFTFSQDEAHPDIIKALPVSGMEYYRPSKIKVSLQ